MNDQVQPQAQAQPVQVPAQPVMEQQPSMPQSIPYSRFAEVVAQKNAALEQLNQYQQMQAQQPQQSSQGRLETVDDLFSAVDQKVQRKLEEAYQARLAPLEQGMKDYRFQGTIENYFASSPDKAQLRADMDAYTATLTPQEQNFLKESIAQGRTQWLDNIYYTVATQKQNSLVNQASRQNQQSAGFAQSPQQFRTIGAVEPTLGDKIQNAKQTGKWNDVFASLVPRG